MLDTENSYLYIDVGGGSTELTLYHKSEVVLQKSFNIGTVRMLAGKVEDNSWNDMKIALKEIAQKHDHLIGIGSGGNINKIYSLIGAKNGESLSFESIKELYKEMQPLSVEERMNKYKIKKDRAEVIVPALAIYNSILKWGDIKEINVPRIGLADGLIHHLYDQILST